MSRVWSGIAAIPTGIGRFMAAPGVAVVAAVVAVIAVVCCGCGGLWVFFGPVNYFGCGRERPAGITMTDLAGRYITQDGGWLELNADGTLAADGIANRASETGQPLLGGPGTWQLEAEEASFDIVLRFPASPSLPAGAVVEDIEIDGTRERPWLYWYTTDRDTCRFYGFTQDRRRIEPATPTPTSSG